MTLPTAFAFGVFFGICGTMIVTYLTTHPDARAGLWAHITGLFKKTP